MKNKIIIEIFGILVLASILGLLFNIYNNKSVPLIRQAERYIYSSEDDIFLQDIVDTNVNQNIFNKDTIENIKLDSNKSAKNNLSKDSLNKITNQVNINKNEINNEGLDNINNSAYKNVNYEFVKKHLNDKRVIIIDSRNPIDFKKGHIGNSINIDPQQEEQDLFFNSIMSLSLDKIYIIYCTGGQCDLSHQVYDVMKNFGFKNIYIYPGGWDEWSGK